MKRCWFFIGIATIAISGLIYVSNASIKNASDTYNAAIENANDMAKEIKDTEIVDTPATDIYKDMTKTEIELLKVEQYEKIGYALYDMPYTSGFKSFMDYKTITDTSSDQYKLQMLYAETNENGIRIAAGRYCVALGSYFQAAIGQYFDIILENGTVLPCIVADIKDDKHTDSNNIVTVHSGCATEFVVDTMYIDQKVAEHGDMSFGNDSWDSPAKTIKIYDVNIFKMP